MQISKQKLAFSLIELSIVILIIGILIVGISKGSRIIRASKLKSAQTLTTSSPVTSMDGILVWYESTLDKSFIASEAINTAFGATGTISTWNDINPQTTTPNIATQTTGADKPRYVANAINGLPAVNFDGVSDYISYDGTKLANTNYTIFVVEQRRASANYMLFLAGTDTGTDRLLHLGYKDNTTLMFAQYGDDYDIAVSSYSSPIARIHSYRFSSTKGKNYNINGINANMTPSACCAPPVPTQGLLSYLDARIGGKDTNWYNGDIGEVIIFTKYLTDNERANVEKYLKAKWGVK